MIDTYLHTEIVGDFKRPLKANVILNQENPE